MKRKVENYEFTVLNDSKAILVDIGMPEKLYNPRCVMMFAALAQMKEPKWRSVSENYHSIHDLIAFINQTFPNKAGMDHQGYQENSRESFRKDTIKPWIAAGIIEGKPGLAVNDKNNAYRFTSQFAVLVRSYGTVQWEEQLAQFRDNHKAYKELLEQTRDLDKGYPVDYCGMSFTLGRSPHNKLQKAILDEFAPRFSPAAELLYIGDTSDRNLHRRDERMHELGVNILAESGKMPDIILYDGSKDRILFIEAYTSTGEFNIDRVSEIINFCSLSGDTEVAFITAFLTTNEMLKVYKHIAWDTDIWVVETPTHMVHKNGDRFLGRKLE